MKRTINKVGRALSIKNVQKAVRNPNKVLDFADGMRADSGKIGWI